MRMLLAIPLLVALAAGAAQDPPPSKKVYRWVDEKGVVHYTDEAPARNAKPAQLPPLQTYEPDRPPALLEPAAKRAAAPPPADAEIRVISPAPDQTFRGADQDVVIGVQLTPPQDAPALVYFLDEQPLTVQPISDTSYTLEAIDRGSHTVVVALMDAEGREVTRSEPVTFHVHVPVVKKPATPRR